MSDSVRQAVHGAADAELTLSAILDPESPAGLAYRVLGPLVETCSGDCCPHHAACHCDRDGSNGGVPFPCDCNEYMECGCHVDECYCVEDL